ncbi:MAG: hypothetical protein KFF73_07730, partial [Cyclobacteriaceae bacterium]|nr:hypothetical protein [Cyclobacteriaceae bacterium]
MLGTEGRMKIVNNFGDGYSRCFEGLAKLIADRIEAEQNGSKLNLRDYEKGEFINDLDSLLELDDSFSFEEKLVLFLAITPYIKPGYMEEVIAQALPQGGEFIGFGGVKGQQHRGILPTGETALFLLAGMNIRD